MISTYQKTFEKCIKEILSGEKNPNSNFKPSYPILLYKYTVHTTYVNRFKEYAISTEIELGQF